MDRPIVTKHEEEQTGAHLMAAGTASVFSILLIIITFVMSWELWTVPLMAIGIIAIWCLHIGRIVSGGIYEYMCTGLMTIELFYFGVHTACLFDVPIAACVLLFMLALLDKKPLLYLVNSTYVLVLLYHLLVLRTINISMSAEGIVRLVLGIVGTIGAMGLSGTIISRRREERKRMNEVADELEMARRQNADFLSNVSHELRTPINMVTGISEVTMEKQISPEIREVMQSIQMAGKRLAGQINDILDYTEIAGNTLVVTNENYMPSSVVNDVITMVDMMNQEHNLEMVFDLDTQIPAVLVGDAEKISRVLRILLQNAIKFTEEGGIYVRVGYRQERYGVNLDITICDTGIGITPSQLPHIYEDFYQADSGRSRYAGGLGLGIPIARGLLHAMGGFIHYSSKENQGTQIHISIPQGVADSTPSMTVTGSKQICAVCYFRQDKYSRNEVRQFYDNMILHMAEGLGIQAYRAYQFGDLEKLMNNQPTHMLLGQEEYVENIPYFEELGKTVCVVLIADRSFMLQEKSGVILLHKPFFVLPIVNLLNGVTYEKNAENGVAAERAFSCEGIHVLVVDDEEMNLVVARGILGSYGILVDTCLSGAAAVEKCMQSVYDLIFLDHMMPGMDGVETLRRIRALKEEVYQNLPIIALTANAISGAREMFKGEGFTEFVPKPIERPVLERVLRKILPEQRIRYHETQGVPTETEAGTENRQKQEAGREVISSGSVLNAVPTSARAVATEPEEAPVERLRQIGINVELGLSYCGGAEDFYLEMLKMYCDQSEEKREEIIALYESEEWTDYAIKVHALKSTSLTIGAEDLSAQAKALELAGKDGDIAFIRENHEKLMQAYDSVCGLIRENMSMEGRGLQF